MNHPRVVPVQRAGAIGNTYHPPGRSLTGDELAWVRNRPEGERRPMPAVGAIVGWREVEGGPVVRATVVEVESVTDPWAHESAPFEPHGPDPNVWRVVTNPETATPLHDALGRYVFAPVPDPWPAVVVRIDPTVINPGTGPDLAGREVIGRTRYMHVREARLPGSAGWLPAEDINHDPNLTGR